MDDDDYRIRKDSPLDAIYDQMYADRHTHWEWIENRGYVLFANEPREEIPKPNPVL